MRILVIIQNFKVGGAERIAIRLANCWADLGAEAEILAGSCDGPLRDLVSAKVVMTCREAAADVARPQEILRRMIRAQAWKKTPDIVFLPGNHNFDLSRTLRKFAPGSVIVGKISKSIVRPGEGPIKFFYRSRRLRFRSSGIRRIFLTDPVIASETQGILGGPPERYATVGHPVLDAVCDHIPAAAADGYILAAGRLAPQKNFALAIRTLANLPPGIELAIAGDGPLREDLGRVAETCGVADRVRFLGYCPDMRLAYAGARLFLLSSNSEGFPSVIVEALAHGVPVVATDCSPSIGHFLNDPRLGTVVPARDVAALTTGVREQLAKPPPDRALLARTVLPFALREVAQKYVSSFEELLR